MPFPSGSACAYFGSSGCGYNHDVGDLTLLQPIQLPTSAAGIVLRFQSREHVECGACAWGLRLVYASTDGGALWQLLGEGNLSGPWYEKWIDLTALRGEDILLRFQFDAVDPFYSYHGWCIDDVRVEATAVALPDVYCTAQGSMCESHIDFAGLPSGSSGSPFTIAGRAIPRMRRGVLLFGHAAASHPFQGGVLCVQPPITRTQSQNSGGIPWQSWDCMGSFAVDFNTAIRSGAHPSLVPGARVNAQSWYNLPTLASVGLTDALQFVIEP